MILFYGPTTQLISGKPYGPGIKNFHTIEALKKEHAIKSFDTANKSLKNRIKVFFSLLFSRKRSISAVSSGGRKVIFPIFYLKKKLFRKFDYSIIVINAFILEEIKKNKKYIKYLKNATGVFVEIENVKNILESDYGLTNVFHFPNFKPDSHYVEENRIANFQSLDSSLRCAFLARVCESKGIIEAIETIEQLRKENLDVSLDLYGPVYEDCEDLMKSLPSSVTYRGIAANHEVTEKLKDYNLFLFPSKYKYEGFPASIIDAYSAGLPVISSDIAFLASIVKDHKNGIIIQEVNVDTLSKAIKTFYHDRDFLTKIAHDNYQESQNYRTSIVLENLLNNFKKIGW